MKRAWVALVLFGVGFGYVEAAVVEYLRALYDPIHERLHTGRPPGDLFPVLTVEQVRQAGPEATRWLATELVREAATLVMLAGVGLAVGRTVLEGFAAFLIAFGVWDISYYLFLKLLIDWPASVFDWDLLFLLPVPWVGPVLAPVLVSASMIVAGGVVLARAKTAKPVRLTQAEWLGVVAGGLVVVLAFCWEAAVVARGGLPQQFPWPLFVLGEVVGIAAFCRAARRGPPPGVPSLRSAEATGTPLSQT